MHLVSRTDPEDSSLREILDRILDKGIVLEAWARVLTGKIDFRTVGNRIVVAPERRRKAFVVPANPREH
ncbi:MAG TPA: gas vesicle protein GvpJ [Candidatus Angelobacter sp.]